MPLYTFKSGKKIQDFFFSYKEVISIGKTIEIEGKLWTRIPVNPNIAIDEIGKINPDDPKDFVRKTAQKKGNYGDLIDEAARLSKEREAKYGKDSIKEKFETNHKKKRKGKDTLRDTNILAE